jgi:hypothetical protein
MAVTLLSRVTLVARASLFRAPVPQHGDGIGNHTTGPQQ